MRKSIVVLSGLALALAGCVYPTIAQRQAYLAQFIGASEADLVRALGVPTRSIDADGHRFLAYDERKVDILPGYGMGSYWNGFYGPFFGPPIYAGTPQQVLVRECETTFELNGGKVASFSLRGNAC